MRCGKVVFLNLCKRGPANDPAAIWRQPATFLILRQKKRSTSHVVFDHLFFRTALLHLAHTFDNVLKSRAERRKRKIERQEVEWVYIPLDLDQECATAQRNLAREINIVVTVMMNNNNINSCDPNHYGCE